MELGIDTPKFKIPEFFKGLSYPLTKEGTWGLIIVLGAVMVISGVVYVGNLGKRTESTVLPAKTEGEVIVTEEELTASPTSPTREVGEPTATPTPVVEGVTVTPTPTI